MNYIIDGYVIFRHKNLAEYRRSAEEKWREKVIRPKGIKTESKDIVPPDNPETILQFVKASLQPAKQKSPLIAEKAFLN